MQKSPHSHLYIALVIVIILAAVYFLYQQAPPTVYAPTVEAPTTQPVSQTVTLTPPQVMAKQEILNNTKLTRRVTLTKEQIATKMALLKQ